MDRMSSNTRRVQGRREMALSAQQQHNSLPARRLQRNLSQHSKSVHRNVQQFTRSLSSERMRTTIQSTCETKEVRIDVTTAEEYCYVETRHREEICISPVEYSTRDVISAGQGRSLQTKPRVMGRRQMRELRAAQKQSRWESESVDSGHCSEFSSRSSLSSAASTHSGDSSFSEDDVFVSGDEIDTTLCAPPAEYASVIDTPVKKLDNTYASIHSICDTPPTVIPPELPPRNRNVPSGSQSKKSLGFTDRERLPTPAERVIVKSKYHKYTVDDIVDSYMSLVNEIPAPPCEMRRSKSASLQHRTPVQTSPMRRTKSAQLFTSCPQTVTKATSSFAVKYNVSLDCNEVFF